MSESQRSKNLFLLCLGLCLLNPAPLLAAEERLTLREKEQILEEALNFEEEKISLDLQDVEVVELLRILSLKTRKTIVPSKEVSGRITLFLNNISFRDALDIILVSQGLASERKKGIIYILSNSEYKRVYGRDYIDPRKIKTLRLTYAKPSNVFNAISQLKSEIGKIVTDESTGTIILLDIPEKLETMEKAVKELDKPLETTVFDINYAKPADAKTQLAAVVTPGTGEVIVDERSSKAIVTDLPKKMDKIKQVVKAIDEETRQVFIDTQIVEVYLNDKHEHGINWEKIFSERMLDGLDFAGYFPLSLSAAYQKITVGSLAKNNYNTVLEFLETYGNTKTLSRPQISVVNNEEAKILVGTRDAYITQTQSQGETTLVTAESIEFVDVGIKLRVVPTINNEGFITMKIKPEVSSVSDTIETSYSRIPIVATSEAETVVKVKDGTMIMIAGLMKHEKKDNTYGWPILSRIPFLNLIFGNRTTEDNLTEVIIFITPYISRGDATLKGKEPEKLMPPEIMPEDTREFLIEKKILSQGRAQEALEARQKKETKLVEWGEDELKQIEESKQKALADKIWGYYQQGLEFQRVGRLTEAAGCYKKILRLKSNYAPAYNQLGIIFEIQGFPLKAEQMYLKAVSVDPGYAASYANLALLSEAKNDFDQAAVYWRKAAELGGASKPETEEAMKRLSKLEP